MGYQGNVFHRKPGYQYPVVSHGEGVYLFDTQGKRYLDGSSGALAANLGHGLKEIAHVMAEQAGRVAFAHTSQFTSEAAEELADHLATHAPAGVTHTFFVNSGSEATEAAIKLSRQYFGLKGQPQRYKVIGRWHSYHGNTLGALSAGGNIARRAVNGQLLHDWPHVPAPYCKRCPFNDSFPKCGLRCAEAVRDVFQAEDPSTVAAFISEPISGASLGGVVPPTGYYERVREICSEFGVLFIADEVMTGLGRTGKLYGIQHWDVVPDVVALGKGLSGGYAPIAAMMVKTEIHDTFVSAGKAFVHGHTYGGNPVSTAVALAAQRYIETRDLVENARARGEELRAALTDRLTGNPIVGDIRGKGLMQGVEIVADAASGNPFPAATQAAALVGRFALDEGLLIYPGSWEEKDRRGDHFLIGPPLVISTDEVVDLVDRLGRAMDRAALELAGGKSHS